MMQCISTVSFSILINGVSSAPFVPSRDIKQRDSLSPYLFLFIFQALSYYLWRMIEVLFMALRYLGMLQ